MFRTSDVILIAVMLSAAAFTYKTKHDAEAMMREVRSLQTQIQLEKDAIDVLKADWSLLTQPERLARLVEVYEEELGLMLPEPERIVGEAALRQIPFRRDVLVAEEKDEGSDPIVTGGVQP